MSMDSKTPSLSLLELAKKLAESRVASIVLPQTIPRLIPPPPSTPPTKDLKSTLTKKWHPGLHSLIQGRLKKITRRNYMRIRNITKGLTMPEITSVPIGSAKRMEAAILFIDLENFTDTASKLSSEDVLFMLNIIIPEMMQIIRRWNGEIEKNTGDGLMAIFGTETRNNFLITRDTIESAMTMRYVMLNDIQPKLFLESLPSINFRIGIDMGEVLISRIGMNNVNFLTVVGSAANRASKLQSLADSNGICIGDNFYRNMAPLLQSYCVEDTHTDWKWQYTSTGEPYRFFRFIADWPDPKEWIKVKLD